MLRDSAMLSHTTVYTKLSHNNRRLFIKSSRYKANCEFTYYIIEIREKFTVTTGRKCEKLKVKKLVTLKMGLGPTCLFKYK